MQPKATPTPASFATELTPTLDTACGRVRGHMAGGVARFLGLPYAAAPLGALRLRSPRAARPWAGVRDATAPGPACLQAAMPNQSWLNGIVEPQAEDCLTLNIWTPDTAGRAPVLFWVHGGQTRHGHGAAAAIDGTALARQGLVVVTINYRLGALGGLAHPDLRDPDTGLCANWGLQDKLAALQWVHEHIQAFGGDPARVALAGQSSGAANAALIAQHGLGAGHYTRLIVQSPPLFRPPMFAELDAAAEYTEAFAASLGLPVAHLATLDGAVLQEAERAFASSAAVTARMGRPRTAPVRDGTLLRHWSHDAPPAAVPVLASWTRSESDFWFRLRDAERNPIAPQRAPQSAAELHERCAQLIRQHHAFAASPSPADVLAAYADLGDAQSTWRAVYTDLVFRAPILHLLGKQARAGRVAFAAEFAHPVASADGGSPHAADVPFVFGTVGRAPFDRSVGSAPSVARCSAAMMAAWTAFVRDGRPGRDDGGAWPPFQPENPQVLRFDGGPCSLAAPERAAALDCWSAYRP